MVFSIIFAILFAAFILVLAYFVYYIVDVIKSFLRIMHKGEELLDGLRREQHLVEDIATRSKNTVEGVQNIIATADEIIKAGKGVKQFWVKKKVKNRQK